MGNRSLSAKEIEVFDECGRWSSCFELGCGYAFVPIIRNVVCSGPRILHTRLFGQSCWFVLDSLQHSDHRVINIRTSTTPTGNGSSKVLTEWVFFVSEFLRCWNFQLSDPWRNLLRALNSEPLRAIASPGHLSEGGQVNASLPFMLRKL